MNLKRIISFFMVLILALELSNTPYVYAGEPATYSVEEIYAAGSKKIYPGDKITVKYNNSDGGCGVWGLGNAGSFVGGINGRNYYSNFTYTVPDCAEGYHRVISFIIRDVDEYNKLTLYDTSTKIVPDITGVDIQCEDSIEIAKNTELKAVVNGTEGCSQEVKWEILSEHDENTYIKEGRLYISPYEKSQEIELKAVSIEDDEFSDIKTISITKPIISKVEVTPAFVSANKGEDCSITASVLGDSNPEDVVEWTIENNTSDKTKLTEESINSCKIYIGEDEKSKIVLVKAKSLYSDEYAYCSVEVITPSAVVEKVELNYDTTRVEKGKTLSIEGEVIGLYEPSQELIWDIKNNTSDLTTITGDENKATLSIAKDEKAEFIVVIAKSSYDQSKLATMIVYIDESSDSGEEENNNNNNDVNNENNSGNSNGESVDDKEKSNESNQVVDDEKKPSKTTENESSKSSSQNINTELQKGKIISDGKYVYRIISTGKSGNKVSVIGLKKRKLSTIKILKSVNIDGVTYIITSIGKGTFKNNKKIKKVYIDVNIKTIGVKAFYGCKKLKSIVIRSKIITKVGKNAFKKINKKVILSIPKSCIKKYKKIFNKKTGVTKATKIKRI